MRAFATIRLLPMALMLSLASAAAAQTAPGHPSLVLERDDVPSLKAGYAEGGLFARSVDRARAGLDKLIAQPIAVPVPKDAGGGYTHEQHKRNYKAIYDAGSLYLITGEAKYAGHAKKLLLAYADLYPTLGEHPKKKEQSPGRLFWQSLNETVFLVYAIQGYDAIYDQFTVAERAKVEQNLFRRMATFLSEGQPKTFNKIHNHGTWAVAGVGMTGYVLGDRDLVDKALMGLDKSGNAGYLKQLDMLFSPDGYYAEGPYYQRYALMPFIVFARAIETNEPERKIFAYRDGILLKAVRATVHQSYAGLFFPINDAIKDKGLDTAELTHGIAIAYGVSADSSLLSVAQAHHDGVVLTGDGLRLANAIEAGAAKPFPFRSMTLSDGASGDRGALVIMRAGQGERHQALVMKNTSQGMGHGHFDKLGWLFFDNGREIIQDYGAARFLNVEAKYGGHYLPENKSWAKQTISHNALVVDEKSHFGGKTKVGEKHDPEMLHFDEADGITIAAARARGAYDGVTLVRTMALIDDPVFGLPIVLDIMKARSADDHQYDLPIHFAGHIIDHSFDVTSHTNALAPLGAKNGYQHLWRLASGTPDAVSAPARVTWLTGKRFYSLNTVATPGLEVIFTRLGANDPKFNLRGESSLILRLQKAQNATFVSVLEPHGEYNPSVEYTVGSKSRIRALDHTSEDGLDFIRIETASGQQWGLALSYDRDQKKPHTLTVDGRTYDWRGFYKLFKAEFQPLESAS